VQTVLLPNGISFHLATLPAGMKVTDRQMDKRPYCTTSVTTDGRLKINMGPKTKSLRTKSVMLSCKMTMLRAQKTLTLTH